MANKLPPAAFDEVAAAFADYGTTVRGYVRYQLAQRNLRPYVSEKKLRVLDVGGGSGGDAAWLAGLGHRVTFIEPSVEQRRFAERRFNFMLNDDERPRIVIAGETLEDLPSATQPFDLVLIHMVAMHQAEPDGFIRRALAYVKPGGVVSIIEKNYYGTEVRDIRDGNYADLNRLHSTGRSVNNLHQDVHAFKPEALEQLLQKADFEILDWSGIRLITDDFAMPVERVPSKQLKVVLDTEYEHGHHPAMRGQGQMVHFIARR